tara:strand:- start:1807 stop:2667 length:861 start_codon:yes stop_codon:yes gene_type:complete
MTKNNSDKKNFIRNWLIKKLLVDESTKQDILNFITNQENNAENLSTNNSELNDEKNLIKNIINLSEKSVEDVMVPRAEIISIEKKQNIKEILEIIKHESHSRMPVYDQNLDNTLGFFHIKDFIKNIENENFKLKDILRQVLYVAPKSPILELLKRMRSSRIHMGLVVDEFGGVDGLVTIEDLVEEIVGEIEDEHDAEDQETQYVKINESTIIVDASYKIDDLEEIFKIKIHNNYQETIDTVGGLVFYIANKVPKNNETFLFKNLLKFEVINADNRRIFRVKVIKIN